MMELLSEDNKLHQIVQLVGEDVLPNDQRIVIRNCESFGKRIFTTKCDA